MEIGPLFTMLRRCGRETFYGRSGKRARSLFVGVGDSSGFPHERDARMFAALNTSVVASSVGCSRVVNVHELPAGVAHPERCPRYHESCKEGGGAESAASLGAAYNQNTGGKG